MKAGLSAFLSVKLLKTKAQMRIGKMKMEHQIAWVNASA